MHASEGLSSFGVDSQFLLEVTLLVIRLSSFGPDWLIAKIWLPKLWFTKILAAIWCTTKIYQHLIFGMLNLC
jgi:hypothetical protein